MSDLKKRLHPMEQLEMPELWADIERRRPGLQPDEPEPRWRRVVIAVAALAIAVGAVALAVNALSEHPDRPGNSPEITPPLARNGVIAFGSIAQEGLFWTVQQDGSDRRVVHVDVPGYVGVPSWSPDGTRIVFTLQSYDDPHPEGGNYDIYTADADGSNPLRLTHDQADRSAVWSPDGTRIAYVNESSSSQIWVMNADGSDARQLTDGEDAVSPSWSPDGSQIAFVSWDESNANVYLMKPDGSDMRRLTDDPAHEDTPVWSPDGESIAFASDGGSRDPGIYTMRPDGTGTTELLPDPDPANLGFAWSPDGTSMAVVSITGPRNERTLSVMDVATRQLTPIADPGAYFGPSWQPLPTRTDAAPPAMSPTEGRVAGVIDVGPATALAYGEGSVWVAVHPVNESPGILRIDARTDEVVASIWTSIVPSWEVGGGGLAIAEGAVWAAGSIGGSEGAIIRIDPDTNRVAETIEVPPGPVVDVAVNDDGIWAMIDGNRRPEVVRIDPSTNQIVATIPLGGGYGRSILAGEGWVLAAVTQPPDGAASGGSLVYIDPATNAEGGIFDLGTYPSVAQGDGAVWAVTETGLVQIDPLSAQPLGEEATIGCTGDALTVGGGGVWCFDPARERALTRFNPVSGEVDVKLGRGDGTGGLALATSPGSVWVIDGANLVRVDLVAPSDEAVTVPDVIGLSFEEARAQIEAAGLTVGDVHVATGGYINEAVVEAHPAAGSEVDAGTPVDLVTGPSGAG